MFVGPAAYTANVLFGKESRAAQDGGADKDLRCFF
jgi:hypothetical protein